MTAIRKLQEAYDALGPEDPGAMAMDLIRHIAGLYSGKAIKGDFTQVYITGNEIWMAQQILADLAELASRDRDWPQLSRTREQWAKVDPELCAEQNSKAANMHLINDAKRDIDQLHSALSACTRTMP